MAFSAAQRFGVRVMMVFLSSYVMVSLVMLTLTASIDGDPDPLTDISLPAAVAGALWYLAEQTHRWTHERPGS